MFTGVVLQAALSRGTAAIIRSKKGRRIRTYEAAS